MEFMAEIVKDKKGRRRRRVVRGKWGGKGDGLVMLWHYGRLQGAVRSLCAEGWRKGGGGGGGGGGRLAFNRTEVKR